MVVVATAFWIVYEAMPMCKRDAMQMKKFWGYVGAVLMGGAFIGIGYAIYSGNPLPDQNITYGGIDPNEVQMWLINRFGETGTGLGLIFTGVGLAGWSIWQGHRPAK